MSYCATPKILAASIACLATGILAGCTSLIAYESIQSGDLKGRVVVEWDRQDKFIFRQQKSNVFSFKPSFMNTAIVPEDMYTDGGSVPQIFWSVPGLSPWGLGPAYIVHDWLFKVHQCKLNAPPEVKQITFDQSAIILAEVAKGLADAGLIEGNRIREVVWAVQTKYARDLWERTPNPDECRQPPAAVASRDRPFRRAGADASVVVDFSIPPPRR